MKECLSQQHREKRKIYGTGGLGWAQACVERLIGYMPQHSIAGDPQEMEEKGFGRIPFRLLFKGIARKGKSYRLKPRTDDWGGGQAFSLSTKRRGSRNMAALLKRNGR